MSEKDRGAQPNAVQTDKESQEYGAQHGQTPQGEETGSSSPSAEAGEGAQTVEREGEGTGARAGDYS